MRSSSKECCKYCGMSMHGYDVIHRDQVVHTPCALRQPPDLIVQVGTFHAELRTELIPKGRMNHFWVEVRKLMKQQNSSK